MPAGGLFVLIGARPQHRLAAGVDRPRSTSGFLLTGPDLAETGSWLLERAPVQATRRASPESSPPATPGHGSVKRVGSAVGEGAVTVQLIHALFASERLYQRTSLRSM